MKSNVDITAVVIATVVILAGCTSVNDVWQKTRSLDTPEAYETFLRDYPFGGYSDQARSRLRELNEDRDFGRVTHENIGAFINAYPNSPRVSEALVKAGAKSFDRRTMDITLLQAMASEIGGIVRYGGSVAFMNEVGADERAKCIAAVAKGIKFSVCLVGSEQTNLYTVENGSQIVSLTSFSYGSGSRLVSGQNRLRYCFDGSQWWEIPL